MSLRKGFRQQQQKRLLEGFDNNKKVMPGLKRTETNMNTVKALGKERLDRGQSGVTNISCSQHAYLGRNL